MTNGFDSPFDGKLLIDQVTTPDIALGRYDFRYRAAGIGESMFMILFVGHSPDALAR